MGTALASTGNCWPPAHAKAASSVLASCRSTVSNPSVNFTLTAPPAVPPDGSRTPLVLTLAIVRESTSQLDEQRNAVAFLDGDGHAVLHYAGLHAWDATRRNLPAHLE